MRAASRKQTSASLRGSVPLLASKPEEPPGWYLDTGQSNPYHQAWYCVRNSDHLKPFPIDAVDEFGTFHLDGLYRESGREQARGQGEEGIS